MNKLVDVKEEEDIVSFSLEVEYKNRSIYRSTRQSSFITGPIFKKEVQVSSSSFDPINNLFIQRSNRHHFLTSSARRHIS